MPFTEMKMHMKWMNAFWALALAALIPAAAQAPAANVLTAQAPAAPAKAAYAQTDIAGSFYGTFTTKSVTGGGITQTSTNSIGALLELRHIQSPWIGYELAFSLNPDNQTVTPVPGACGFFCSSPPQSLSVLDPAFSLDWIVSRQYRSLRPFLSGGFGFTYAMPAGIKGTYLNVPVKPTTVGGAGVDWGIGSRFGIRLQYRENIFTAPHINPFYPNAGRFTPEGEPMVGVYFQVNNLLNALM